MFFFCRKHYKISAFSRSQLLWITNRKAPFRGPFPKWHFCKQKCHFWFSLVPAEAPIFVVFGDFLRAQKRTIFQKQLASTKRRVFYLPNTNSVRLFFWENAILTQKSLLFTTTPKHKFSVSFFHFWFFVTREESPSTHTSPQQGKEGQTAGFVLHPDVSCSDKLWTSTLFVCGSICKPHCVDGCRPRALSNKTSSSPCHSRLSLLRVRQEEM